MIHSYWELKVEGEGTDALRVSAKPNQDGASVVKYLIGQLVGVGYNECVLRIICYS